MPYRDRLASLKMPGNDIYQKPLHLMQLEKHFRQLQATPTTKGTVPLNKRTASLAVETAPLYCI
jgi:hypothetical protein